MPSGSSTRPDRQAKAAELRAAAAKAEARRRTLLVSSVIAVLVVVIVVVFVIVQNTRRDSETASATPPGNIGASNSIVVGEDSAPVKIVVYEDFQCPYCAQFESANRDQIAAWVKAGNVQMQYRPIAFLDASSTTEYSTRALNAAAAVQNSDPADWVQFHNLLFENQPAEGTAGLTDAQLIAYAVQAGADKATITKDVNEQTYQGWTVRVTEDSSKAGISSTPTVLVNGKSVASPDAATMKSTVEAAIAAAKK
jgi:protein-disulfide isomerase